MNWSAERIMAPIGIFFAECVVWLFKPSCWFRAPGPARARVIIRPASTEEPPIPLLKEIRAAFPGADIRYQDEDGYYDESWLIRPAGSAESFTIARVAALFGETEFAPSVVDASWRRKYLPPTKNIEAALRALAAI